MTVDYVLGVQGVAYLCGENEAAGIGPYSASHMLYSSQYNYELGKKEV